MEQLITLIILALVGLAKFLEFYNKQKDRDTTMPKPQPGRQLPQRRHPVPRPTEEYKPYRTEEKNEEDSQRRPEPRSEYHASQEDIQQFLENIGILKPSPPKPSAEEKRREPQKVKKRKHPVKPEQPIDLVKPSKTESITSSQKAAISHGAESMEEHTIYDTFLHDPDYLRTAFVMHEILQPPKALRKRHL